MNTVYNAWNTAIQRRDKKKELARLFELRTPYGESPCDGMIMTSDHPLTEKLFNLVKEVSKVETTRRASSSKYKKMIRFGPVIVWFDPLYRNSRKCRVRINPSSGCMTVEQILHWVEVIFGRLDGIYIRAADLKVDIDHRNLQSIVSMCWAPNFRSRKTFQETVYYGSSKSCRQLSFYDKQKEMLDRRKIQIGYVKTRMEMKLKFKKSDEIPLISFLSMNFKTLDPFKGVVLINASKDEFLAVLKGKQKKAFVDNDVYHTMRAIESRARNRIIQELSFQGRVKSIAALFNNQMDKWVA